MVSLLADILYLTVTFHLVQPLVCNEDGFMVADESVECWKGSHKWLAAACLVSLTFYVCLSVMLAPMLASDQPPSQIAFVKAYLMFVVLVSSPNIQLFSCRFLSCRDQVKTVMIVSAALFHSLLGDLSVVVSNLLACGLLLLGTGKWLTVPTRFFIHVPHSVVSGRKLLAEVRNSSLVP